MIIKYETCSLYILEFEKDTFLLTYVVDAYQYFFYLDFPILLCLSI